MASGGSVCNCRIKLIFSISCVALAGGNVDTRLDSLLGVMDESIHRLDRGWWKCMTVMLLAFKGRRQMEWYCRGTTTIVNMLECSVCFHMPFKRVFLLSIDFWHSVAIQWKSNTQYLGETAHCSESGKRNYLRPSLLFHGAQAIDHSLPEFFPLCLMLASRSLCQVFLGQPQVVGPFTARDHCYQWYVASYYVDECFMTLSLWSWLSEETRVV